MARCVKGHTLKVLVYHVAGKSPANTGALFCPACGSKNFMEGLYLLQRASESPTFSRRP